MGDKNPENDLSQFHLLLQHQICFLSTATARTSDGFIDQCRLWIALPEDNTDILDHHGQQTKDSGVALLGSSTFRLEHSLPRGTTFGENPFNDALPDPTIQENNRLSPQFCDLPIPPNVKDNNMQIWNHIIRFGICDKVDSYEFLPLQECTIVPQPSENSLFETTTPARKPVWPMWKSKKNSTPSSTTTLRALTSSQYKIVIDLKDKLQPVLDPNSCDSIARQNRKSLHTTHIALPFDLSLLHSITLHPSPIDVGLLCAIIRFCTPEVVTYSGSYSEYWLRCKDPLESYLDVFSTTAIQKYSERLPKNKDLPLHRQNSARFDKILNPYDIYPRRIWDLWTNRVVPTYFFWCRDCSLFSQGLKISLEFVAISHSWREEADIESQETPINQRAWPVPVPKGMNLNKLRDDVMAKFPGYRFCWLDVLCLRQAETRVKPDDYNASHPLLEILSLGRDYKGDVRAQEYLIDIPTIGNIYNKAKAIYRFMNGLGQEVSSGGWDDPRHWMNRAWTLQEFYPHKIVDGGLPVKGPNFYNISVTRRCVTKRIREFNAELSSIVNETSIIALAAEMGKRHAANELDKIAGLSYLLKFPQLPTYSTDISIDSAWQKCVQSMNPGTIAELFWHYPLAGDSDQSWMPGWPALQACPPSFVPYGSIELSYAEGMTHPKTTLDSPKGLCWKGLPVLGLKSIECVSVGEYLIGLFVGRQKDAVMSIERRFFMSHDGLDLDLSLLDTGDDEDQENGHPVAMSIVSRNTRTRHRPLAIRKKCVLVGLKTAEYDSIAWVLLQYRQDPCSSANVLNWYKVAVLRTDEDVTDHGSTELSLTDLCLDIGRHTVILRESPGWTSAKISPRVDELAGKALSNILMVIWEYTGRL